MDPIVIVGSGLAGYNVARNFRKHDRSSPLVIVTCDGGEFYSKPLLSEALAAGKAPEAIANKTAEQMAAQTGAEVRTHTRVTRIEAHAHEIESNGEPLRYRKLVLAWGADPIRLPIDGDAAQDVLSVNDLADYTRFRAAVLGKHRIVILGGGLIGCEFANDLATAGYQVDVIDIASQPLGRLLPPAGGAFLMKRLSAIGVRWHLQTSARRIDRSGGGFRVQLGNDETLDTDVVLSAIGLRPRTALAQAAGVAVERGIVVDRTLRSSDPDIFALGDCAEVDGLVLPFVAPIMHAAKALAQTLAGEATNLQYPAMPVMVKTPACPTVVAPPPVSCAGAWQVIASDDGVRALYRDGFGKLQGFALNGDATAESRQLGSHLPMWLD